MNLRWRLHRLLHRRWYRAEARAGRFYYPMTDMTLTPQTLLDRGDEVRSYPAGPAPERMSRILDDLGWPKSKLQPPQ